MQCDYNISYCQVKITNLVLSSIDIIAWHNVGSMFEEKNCYLPTVSLPAE